VTSAAVLFVAAALAAQPGADEPAAAAAAPTRATAQAGRTTTLTAGPPVGAPVERAVKPSDAYAQAVERDRDQRWADAAGLYQQAIADWSAERRRAPSAALDRAISKADRERQRSQMLAGLQSQRDHDRLLSASNRGLSLERARIYRTKLMVVRAYTGAVPGALYARTRDELEDALRAAATESAAARAPAETEIRLLLCATRAAGGDRDAARLELAHVGGADRDDPGNALAMAICRAALGQLPEALALLETYIQRQPPDQRLDPFVLRDVYLANDWDRLRGDPRFERLFAGVRRY
jgi:hypothetical protein